MLTFFSINGNMGRLDYYKSFLLRLLIMAFTAFILALICLLVFGDPFISVWSYFLYYPFFVPINFRRANDIRMNWAWLFLGLFLSLLPVVGLRLNYGGIISDAAISTMLYNPGIDIAITIYLWVISLLLLFMPGQAYGISSDQKSRVLKFS